MIAIEIRNAELRAVKFKKGFGSKTVDKVSSVEVNFEEISGLAVGKILPLVDKVNDLLYKLDIGDITKEKYRVAVNLEGVLTQTTQIPKVKDSQIIFSAKSALAKDNILIEDEKITAFAVQKEENVENKTRGYKVLTEVIDKGVATSIVKVFEHLELNVDYVDMAPNTLIKLFNKTNYVNSDKDLTLLVDLSENNIKFYQFLDNGFYFTYLERIRYGDKNHVDVFEDNVYQFTDEFNEYNLDDIEIVLLGKEDLIKEIMLNFDEIFTMKRFAEELDLFKNPNNINLDEHINSLGAMVRHDVLLSSQAKYDIDLLKRIETNVSKGSVKETIKKIAIVGAIGLALGGSYLGIVKFTSMQIAKENKEIEEFIDSPETKDQIFRKEEVERELGVYDSVLDPLLVIEDYLVTTKMPYSSRVYYSLTQSVPRNSRVTNLKYSAEKVEISYETSDENTFNIYLETLKNNPLIKSVEYKGYSEQDDGYRGTMNVVLKGSGN